FQAAVWKVPGPPSRLSAPQDRGAFQNAPYCASLLSRSAPHWPQRSRPPGRERKSRREEGEFAPFRFAGCRRDRSMLWRTTPVYRELFPRQVRSDLYDVCCWNKRQFGITAIDRSAHAAHECGHFVAALKFSSGCCDYFPHTLNSADLGCFGPLASTHM